MTTSNLNELAPATLAALGKAVSDAAKANRANLAAGSHKIRYEPDSSDLPLSGANFVITFRGAEFDGE